MAILTKTAARRALHTFLPKSGQDYTAGRNYDNGTAKPATVSKLSKWIRIRALPEWEVISNVLDEHSEQEASKYIEEVCWRTYWKGWLQMRPVVWYDYLRDRTELHNTFYNNSNYCGAIDGRTGIDCFDAWTRELLETNYLHNHARMWYASIWVHTLKLPWQLGADWFLRHLIDGDPASNTLSWRWITGLHTQGKTYLARPDNIRKYTNNRFSVTGELATRPVGISAVTLPGAKKLETYVAPAGDSKLGLLITDDDLSATEWLGQKYPCVATASLSPHAGCTAFPIEAPIIQFRREVMASCNTGALLEDVNDVMDWVEAEKLDGILTTTPVEGFNMHRISAIRNALEATGKYFCAVRHDWDNELFPHATHGFFRFKKAIPSALKLLDLSRNN